MRNFEEIRRRHATVAMMEEAYRMGAFLSREHFLTELACSLVHQCDQMQDFHFRQLQEIRRGCIPRIDEPRGG